MKARVFYQVASIATTTALGLLNCTAEGSSTGHSRTWEGSPEQTIVHDTLDTETSDTARIDTLLPYKDEPTDLDTETIVPVDTVPEEATETNTPTGLADTEDEMPICAEQHLPITYVPAKLMIALDMSGSMASPDDKYPIAADAIISMLNGFEGKFLFGFDTYPDRFDFESCGVDDAVWIDCGPGNETEIADWLALNVPVKGPGDPLLSEMKKFLDDPKYATGFTGDAYPGDAYLVIVADGDDCCGLDGHYDCSKTWTPELASTSADLNTNGIKTIAVGYTDNADAATLDAIAEQGGTPFERHISALDHGALTSALSSIGETLISCSFDIEYPEYGKDPTKVNFYLDDGVVPFDEECTGEEGWTWTNDTFERAELCNQSCRRVREGDVDVVSAAFGCPIVVT